ncbi:MAG: hypothetical protein AAF639_24225 [Chloroflexota bacterium]
MRQFHSYGPVDIRHHYAVERLLMVEKCLEQLVGVPDEGGHYFTIWGPRQTGKTWLLRQMKKEIPARYGDQFTVFSFSLGNLRGLEDAPDLENDQVFFPTALAGILKAALPGRPNVDNWETFAHIFDKEGGLWDRPVILMIDEADTSPPRLLDWIAGRFRELYLERDTNYLHGLALIGVRAVLGIESKRGSPFNIQKSLNVANLTRAEVLEMYQQYQDERDQLIDSDVIEAIYHDTKGQPGLVSWFGELLTDKYNTTPDQPITLENWKWTQHKARYVEPNNTILNLIAKAQDPENLPFLAKLFTQADQPFAFRDPQVNYLYMHGIIDSKTVEAPDGELTEVCCFSSPFIQDTLYHAFQSTLIGHDNPILVLHPLDELTDVFADPNKLDLPALLRRYKDYLAQLREKGINPWKDQPRRKTDFQLMEAVGHFHLYAWLKDALANAASVSPEFPTGNGQVDLHIRRRRNGHEQIGLIEVKSFSTATMLKKDRTQAARYARKVGLTYVTLAVFVPVLDEDVLTQLSTTQTVKGVDVTVVAIGWV